VLHRLRGKAGPAGEKERSIKGENCREKRGMQITAGTYWEYLGRRFERR